MERKFLAFSCLVLLSSIAYFIYTSYQLHIESKNQQEAESEAPLIGARGANSSFQASTLDNSNPESGWDMSEKSSESKILEDIFKNIELEDIEIIFNTEGFEELETTPSQKQNDPELETLFRDVKQLDDQREELNQAEEPFFKEYVELRHAIFEIVEEMGTTKGQQMSQQLDEDFYRLTKQQNELVPILNAFYEEQREINRAYEKLADKYGIFMTEFHEKHEAAYQSWKAGL